MERAKGTWDGGPDALLLDLDDTLLDGGYLRRSVVATCEVVAGRSEGLDARRLADANAAAWVEYWPTVGEQWTLGQLASDTLRREVWRRALARCDRHDDELVELAARTHAQREREGFRLFDDARALLASLRGSCSLALITNGASDIQREKLRVLGIEPHFAVIVISAEVGAAKPDAAVFAVALDALATPPERAWHVGDNLATDVAGANAAGVRSVWLNRRGAVLRGADHAPDLEIRSLGELTALGG